MLEIMSDKSCFTTDTAVRRELKKIYKLPQKDSVSIGLCCSGFSLYEYFNTQFIYSFFIENHKMCFSKKILYQYFVSFCPALDSFSSENILLVFT